MFSYEYMFQVHGDVVYADKAEQIAYNALPATWADPANSGSMWFDIPVICELLSCLRCCSQESSVSPTMQRGSILSEHLCSSAQASAIRSMLKLRMTMSGPPTDPMPFCTALLPTTVSSFLFFDANVILFQYRLLHREFQPGRVTSGPLISSVSDSNCAAGLAQVCEPRLHDHARQRHRCDFLCACISSISFKV